MKCFSRVFWYVFLATALAGGAVGADNTDASFAELFGNPVVVQGDGFEIRQIEWDNQFTALKATLATQGQTIPPSREEEARLRLLDRLILARVIDRRATAEDRTLAAEAAEKFIEGTRKRAPSEASYARQLLAVGMTVEEFENRAREQALVEQVINRELRDTLTVSAAEIERFYTDGSDPRTRTLAAGNPDTDGLSAEQREQQIAALQRANLARLERPERVSAQLLLLYTVDRITREPLPLSQQNAKRQLAGDLRQRLIDGADFEPLARTYSDDPDVEETGGEYVAARDAAMAPELHAALFNLPVGRWSEVIDTRLGYYVARVKERFPSGKVPLTEAQSDIREFLLTQKVEEKLPAYFQALKREYNVEMRVPAPQ